MTIEINIKDANKGFISGSLSIEEIQKVNLFPDFFKIIGNGIIFKPSRSNIDFINSNFNNVRYLGDSFKTIERIKLKSEIEQRTSDAKKQGLNFGDMDFAFKTNPMRHQHKAFQLCKDQRSFALLMEMGTGKTKVAIDNIAYLYNLKKIKNVVIIAPNGVHKQWALDEIPKHMPDFVDYGSFIFSCAQTKRLQKHLLSGLKEQEKLCLFFINVESLAHKKGQDFYLKCLEKPDVFVCIDESTRIKSQTASRTKFILKHRLKPKYKRILTGSPLTKGVEDFFTQFQFLDDDILGVNSFYAYKNQYCLQNEFVNSSTGRKFSTIVGYKNIEQLKRKIDPYSYRVLSKECLDLPQEIRLTKYVEMTKEQEKYYNELKHNLIISINHNEIVAPLAMTLLMRLQRILCGHIEDENNITHRIKSNRAILCSEIIQDLDQKTIVWCRFKEDINILKEQFDKDKISYIVYEKGDREILNKFKEEDIKVFISNPQSGGIGLNITQAKNMIYYSNDFDLEKRLQSETRAIRKGQDTKVKVIDLICPGSIDQKIVDALNNKKNIAKFVVDDVKEMFNLR